MERTVTCASAGAAMAMVEAARAIAARLALASFMSSPPEIIGGICARLLGLRKRGPALRRQGLEERLERLFDALEGDPAYLVDHGVAVYESADGGRDGLAVFVDREELETGLVDRFDPVAA